MKNWWHRFVWTYGTCNDMRARKRRFFGREVEFEINPNYWVTMNSYWWPRFKPLK